MSRKASKAANSVYYLARMEASENNEMLNSREGAAELIGMDRTKIARIELGSLDPYPEEVELEELDRVTIKMLSAFRKIPLIKEGLMDITADGIVSDYERPHLNQIIDELDYIVNNAEGLKLWCRKNLK